MKTSISTPKMGVQDSDDDDRDAWDDSDETEDQEAERNEATNKLIAEMTDEQRERYNLFQSTNCKFNSKKISEMMKQSIPDSTQNQIKIQSSAGFVTTQAAKLFIADLLETARDLSGNNDPLTPDLIMVAYNEMENAGKIPGKGSGVKRAQIR
ncbi:hypothetical protein TRFO_21577 [Tritrichomonas foetus]|uniref:TAFII28-like protein domain-containing protein n=1 Tax=Tritrichomonas foetus TaxID=1144522 RepID=A0A1J4KDL6_9EUKA|nr:hypothetical protein TRFO_21577 [Tritrichomonas foetus]|eukprot:OHT09529.1 hypothetical protein TRFO_21577 [Tritrichomonas foetus]